MPSSLHHITYSMRLEKFLKMARREKLLQTKSIQWLRLQVKAADRTEKKSVLIERMMEKQFGSFSMEVYRHEKMNRSLRNRK